MKPAALVLAGSRPGPPDPVAASEGVWHKALVEIEGETMLARVVEALRTAGIDRMAVLAGLGCTDVVAPFSENTPLALILAVRPDVLVKGGDWKLDAIVGREQVESWGGTVRAIPIRFTRSTTALIERIRSSDG